MTVARNRLVCLEATPYYHVIGRCVRRAFLCGRDERNGFDYSHRRDWVIERLEHLGRIFAVDLCAYAILSNHYHLVVRIRPEIAQAWTDEEVMDRWNELYGLPDPINIGCRPEASTEQRVLAKELIQIRRERLANLSWFMKCLNEYIARRANAEDHCTGAFWEGRYKSQALLDDKALLSCMAYVDLNPIRAAMAKDLERSDYTAIQHRIHALKDLPTPSIPLARFRDQSRGEDALPMYLQDYLELVDWTGRTIIQGKRGAIPSNVAPILEAIGFDQASWTLSFALMSRPQIKALGSTASLQAAAIPLHRQRFRGASDCQAVFDSS